MVADPEVLIRRARRDDLDDAAGVAAILNSVIADGRHTRERTGMILAGDIGGTKTVLALVATGGDPRRPQRQQRFVSSSFSSLEEIIALWADESETAHAARIARHAGSAPAPLPPIRIEVNAKRGDLFGMQFSDARTLIIPNDQHLLLHPLDFKVGDGYCTTQVVLEYAGANTLLRVSGHVENVDAYQVYNELLDRKSLIRGTLRGDFFLQGELVEWAEGRDLFIAPRDPRTEDYITGRFG